MPRRPRPELALAAPTKAGSAKRGAPKRSPKIAAPRPGPARRAPRPHLEVSPSTIARLRALDESLLRLVTSRRSSLRTFLLTVLCRFADPDVVLMALVVVSLGGLAPMAENVAVSLILTAAVTQTVKRTVRRARPAGDIQALVPPDRYSFPSGHSAAAFTMALTLTGIVPELVPLVLVVACVVAYARMYLGVHYPIDVVCGAVIGMLTGSLVALLPPVSTFLTPLVAPLQAAVLGG